ncbi:MAG: HEAT repeat domain-containing protein [Planctomycetota bacterium]
MRSESTTRRLAALLLALPLAACGEEKTAAPLPPPTLRAVVEETRAGIAADAPAEPEPLSQEALDRLPDLLEFVATSKGDLAKAGRQDLLGLGEGVIAKLHDVALDQAETDAHRSAALATLGDGPSGRAAAALNDVLTQGREPWLRSTAAWYLGEIEDESWVPDAVLHLKYEVDGEVVQYLAQAIDKRGFVAGLPALLVLSTTAADEEQRGAAYALAQKMADERGYATPEELDRAWRAGEVEPPPTTDGLRASIWHWISRLAEWQLRGVDDARYVLVCMGRSAAPMLGEALYDTDPYVRLHTAQVLERMGGRGRPAAKALVDHLRTPDVAPQAAVALGSVGGPSAGPALEAALAPDQRPELRLGAARGLALLADPATLETLRSEFTRERDAWPELAQAVAEARLACGDAGDAVTFATACLDRDGLDPASSGLALEAWVARRAELEEPGFADLLEAWNAIGAKRGPQFDESAMWKERKELLGSSAAVRSAKPLGAP